MKFYEAIRKYEGWKTFQVKLTTVKGYCLDLRLFCLYLHNPEVENVSLDHILDYLKEMKELGWDENTFMRKTIAFRKFFQFQAKLGLRVLDYELIPIAKVETKPQRVIDEVSYHKLLKAIPSSSDPRFIRNKVMLNLLWDTGMRAGELLSLNILDMDLIEKKATIRTEKAKTHRPFRVVFWTNETNENIKKWLVVREKYLNRNKDGDHEALIISISGMKAGKRIKGSGLAEGLRRMSEKAGLPWFNPHSFRHHMGHHIVKMGGSNSDVSNILGHSHLESSFVYTKMSAPEMQERYHKFMGD